MIVMMTTKPPKDTKGNYPHPDKVLSGIVYGDVNEKQGALNPLEFVRDPQYASYLQRLNETKAATT
jgi:hypothetical protein